MTVLPDTAQLRKARDSRPCAARGCARCRGGAQFLTALIDRVLAVTPVQHHVAVRNLRERRELPVSEADAARGLRPMRSGRPVPRTWKARQMHTA